MIKVYLFLLLSILTGGANLCGQTVFRFRASESCVLKSSEDTCHWEKSSTLIVHNTGNKTVTIYTPKAVSFAYISAEIVNLSAADKQDIKMRTVYEAIDPNGNKCRIVISLLTEVNGNLAIFKFYKHENTVFSYITEHVE